MSDSKTLFSKIGVLAGSLILFALLTIPVYVFMSSGVKKVSGNEDGSQMFEETNKSPETLQGVTNAGTVPVGESGSEMPNITGNPGADLFGTDGNNVPEDANVPAGEQSGQGAGGFNARESDVPEALFRLSPVRFFIGFFAILIAYIAYFELVLKKQFYYFLKESSGRMEVDEEDGIGISGPNYGAYLAALLPFLLFLLAQAVEITLLPYRITSGTAVFKGLPWEVAYILPAVFGFFTLISVWMDTNFNHILFFDEVPFCYNRFGHGDKNLILITGLNMRTLRGTGLQMAYFYRLFAKDYTVYVMDKKDEIPEGVTVEDLSEDIVSAMKRIGIQRADVVGVSQGGMIAQYIAINHPEMVDKLVLCVTAARVNDTIQKFINRAIIHAKSGEMEKINRESFEEDFTLEYQQKNRLFLPILAKAGIPKSNTRFIRMAQSCLTVDTYDKLDRITCPVFVISAGKDRTVSKEGTEEIAEKLGCQKYTYSKYGHMVFSEAPDFNERILKFLRKKDVKRLAGSASEEKSVEELEAEFEESLK